MLTNEFLNDKKLANTSMKIIKGRLAIRLVIQQSISQYNGCKQIYAVNNKNTGLMNNTIYKSSANRNQQIMHGSIKNHELPMSTYFCWFHLVHNLN